MPGWIGDLCDIEINECASNITNICVGDNEICTNTPGSFECRCMTGYVRDNVTDECIGKFGC